MGKLLDLAFYNPSLLPDETFLAGFVARKELAAKILARLGDVTPRGIAQHRLIVGQRGMGKTSMLRRIALGVRAQPELAAVLLPLTFREEQYNVHNLHVFWCNCLDSLGDWFEASGQADRAERIDREAADLGRRDDDAEGGAALEAFRRWMKEEGRRPLLMLDNLDIILAGLDDEQWNLRRILQERGGIVVVGASAGPLEAAARQDAPFYEFFQVDVLEKLRHEEVVGCLRRLAGERGDAGLAVLAALDRDPARVRVLYDLTGGNPRTLAMLYLILEMRGDGDVMRDLEGLLDQATPLYKARVEELAPQARVVFDALALAWDPVTAADVSVASTLEVTSVSTQLDRLVKDGVVEKATLSTTAKTAFQVGERFFNIWYLMRHGPRRQRTRLRWLTEVLRCIYSPQELRDYAAGLVERAEGGPQADVSYCFALSEAVDDRELAEALRRRYELEDLPPLTEPAELALKPHEREAALRAAIEREPNRASLWAALALAIARQPGRLEEVEASYRRAIDLDPKDAVSWTALGIVLGDPLGRTGDAEAAYRRAIDLDPSYAGPWNNLGLQLAGPLDRPDEAEAAFRRAIELDPNDAAPWNNLGIVLAGPLGRPEEAEGAYRRAIELDPKHALPWRNLGDLLAGPLVRQREAEAAYRQAIELSPEDAASWIGLGLLLGDWLGRLEEAEAAYRRAIEVDPRSALSLNNLGNLLADRPGRFEEAEAAYRRAIELDPKYALPWNNLGRLADQLGRSDEAEAAYRRAIELDPKYAVSWNNLGIHLEGPPSRLEGAEAAYRRAIEVNPTYASPWRNLGLLLAGPLHRQQEAEAAYRRAIELSPRDTGSWIGLGLLLGDWLGRPEESEAAYRRAIELEPKCAPLWRNLGVLLAGPLGRPEEAEAAFLTAIELDAKDPFTWNGLGNLLTGPLGRTEEGEAAYRRALEIDPEGVYPVANLAYLLLAAEGRQVEAEQHYQAAVGRLSSHGAGVLRAFHAVAHDDFGAAVAELAQVLDEGHPELFNGFRDDLLRVLALAVERGYGDKLLEWFDSSGFGDRYWPLRAALDAYFNGAARLMDVNPEVRSGAQRLLTEMNGLRRRKAVDPAAILGGPGESQRASKSSRRAGKARNRRRQRS